MLLHDVADPFMELSKIGLYLDNKVIPSIAFPIFAAVFIVSRNYIFPRYIIHSVWMNESEYKYYWPTLLWLSVLACLHVFWSYHILVILYHNLRGEKRGDIREEE